MDEVTRSLIQKWNVPLEKAQRREGELRRHFPEAWIWRPPFARTPNFSLQSNHRVCAPLIVTELNLVHSRRPILHNGADLAADQFLAVRFPCSCRPPREITGAVAPIIYARVGAGVGRARLLDALVPVYKARRRWSDRYKEIELPLFPNYVFSRFSWRQHASLFRVPGIRSVVSFGDTPAAISDEEIAALRLMLNSGVLLKPWPYLKPGQKVRIERGPLQGLDGVLVKDNGDWHIVVSVELLQRSVAAVVDRDAVRPA
jgi:transcription antitermination factor NusG